MATIDQSKEPYYNNWDASKRYITVMSRPDVPLQQRELIEMQSQMDSKIKALGDGVYKEGDIIQGLDFSVANSTKAGILTVSIQQGFIYMGGKPLLVHAQNVDIPASGEVYINAIYSEEIITVDEDDTLRDPTIGAPSVSSRGADRLKATVTLTTEQPTTESVVKVYHFVDGNLYVAKTVPGVSKIMDILAQRTDESDGNYRIGHGLEISVDSSQTTDDKVSVLVSQGVGYIKGYRNEKPAMTRIELPVSKDTRTAINETHSFPATKYIELYNLPYASMGSVTAPVSLRQGVSRGSGLADSLSHSNIIGIKAVGSTKGTVYGTFDNPATADHPADVTLTNGNAITWRSGSNVIPVTGGTYQVTYYYVKTMELGKDYKITTDANQVDVNGFPRTFVDFRGMTGDVPATNPSLVVGVSVTYDYYLARRDLITIDQYGNITSLQGTPDTIGQVALPSKTSDDVLPLGWVTVYPNSQRASANTHTVTNLTFESLQKMQARVQTLEYNLSTLAQDVSASTGHDALSLRGVFSDGLNSLERADTSIFGDATYDKDGKIITDNRWKENGKVVYPVANSFDDAMITLPYNSSNIVDLNVNSVTEDSDYPSSMSWSGHVISAPYRYVKEIVQPIATGTINVNPYMVYETQTGLLKLDPAVDMWQENHKIVINNVSRETMTVYRYWRHNGDNWSSDAQFIHDNMNNIHWDNTNSDWLETGNGSNPSGNTSYDGTATGSVTANGGTTTSESAIPFMRQRQVKFTAKGLRPNDDNLYIEFNKLKLETTASAPSTAGSTTGTIRASGTGVASGYFTIPAGQPTGTVDVFLKNDANIGSSANSVFTSQGKNVTTKQVINTTYYTVNFVDPLAQSFQYEGDRILAKVGLNFATKETASDGAPMIVQIRELADGGMPSQKVLGEVSVEAKDVKTSAKGDVETEFVFDDPVMLENGKTYALVAMTNSQHYTVYYAQMGQRRLDNNQVLQTNPYGGVMFSSANAQSWTVHQDSDLKFSLTTVEFKDDTDSVVLFDPVSFAKVGTGELPDVNVAELTAYTPENTGVKWEFRAVLDSEGTGAKVDDGNHPWAPVGETGEYDPNARIRILQLRATFRANKYVSPMLSNQVVSFNSLVTGLAGTYVGKTVSMGGGDSGYNTIDYSYSAYIPEGTTVTPKFKLWHSSGTMPETWETLDTLNKNHKVPVVVPKISAPDVNGMVSITGTIDLPEAYTGALGFDMFKFRLDLESKTAFVRPRARAIKVVLTDM